MAGSIKWFVYTTDAGDDFGVRMDESNGELVGNIDVGATGAPSYALPKNIRPRVARYRSLDGNYQRNIVVSTVAQLDTLAATITINVIGGTVDLVLSRTVGEVTERIVGTDTGLNDGDDT